MITKSVQTLEHSSGWQQDLAQAIRDPAELLTRLRLPQSLLPAARTAAAQFPLRVPLPYLKRIEAGNPDDPLLRQVLPLAEETTACGEGLLDPVGDLQAMTTPGLLHKYHGRALLVTTGACGIHCRYCFRRHFPYSDSNPLSDQHWQQTLTYLTDASEVNEIIFSGGDPLSLSDQRLARMLEQLARIPHLQTVRFHTRLPVVVPDRITDAFLGLFETERFKHVVVLHINHANEIDDEVNAVAEKIRKTGTILLNQAVLLKGVNDDPETLVTLSQRLFDAGILPYYLHQFDPVRSAMHFCVPAERGRELHEQMRHRLPGYLVPRYVQEIAGFESKIPL